MPSREFLDPSGTPWSVFEVHRINDRPNSVRSALSLGWLAFVSATEKRRLPGYPAEWQQFTDDELFELLRSAVVTSSPGRTVSDLAAAPKIAAPAALPAPAVGSELARRVRAHAREARRAGVPVIEAMITLKRALASAGDVTGADELVQLRRLFVQEFYFPGES